MVSIGFTLANCHDLLHLHAKSDKNWGKGLCHELFTTRLPNFKNSEIWKNLTTGSLPLSNESFLIWLHFVTGILETEASLLHVMMKMNSYWLSYKSFVFICVDHVY